ncbi:unnamed protein product [Lactuca saligna]|uniref:FLZ-type domain-containing protein n=1 Tax=Lactuca saligna TaxID=75948 RepID=A0AA36EIG0_LACSI|nr:unnamed protein product [Lactuca saligna]
MANTQNPTKQISSFLGSPRLFNVFMAKTLSDAESSPTSVLDTKQFFTTFRSNPFQFKQSPEKPRKISDEIKNPFEKFECENGIALALLQENPNNTIHKPNSISRKVLFGSTLRIQIPSHSKDPCDFGIKSRNLQSPGRVTTNGPGSPRASMDALSLSEMELSEEYTRVISYGSNPKITHIYDNCVVGSYCDALHSDHSPKSPWQSFSSLCYTCKKNFEENSDIFMYRGEKGFCSEECRCQEMIMDELMNSEQLCQ